MQVKLHARFSNTIKTPYFYVPATPDNWVLYATFCLLNPGSGPVFSEWLGHHAQRQLFPTYPCPEPGCWLHLVSGQN